MRETAQKKAGVFTPPLKSITKASMMVAMHIAKGRKANRQGKVAWVTSGFPVEVLSALDFYTFYPENHGAICGTAGQSVSISIEAENQGYSRDLCSYARTDIGALLSGRTPIKKIPAPDILVACTNICQTVLHWYRILAHHFEVPFILIDAPFIYDRAPAHAVAYVRKQIEESVPQMEATAGKSLDLSRLREITSLSRMASQLWMEALERGKNRPTPLSAFDQFRLMAPIVEMRGTAKTVDLYVDLLVELDERIENGIGVIVHERKRLLWDNLPIWYKLDYLAEILGTHGIVLAASTYTAAWGELAEMFDPEHPFESAARTYLHPILNRSTRDKLLKMLQVCEGYQLDGVILHSDRSCKPYSIGQIDQRDQLINEYGIPALLLEADHNDQRAFSQEQITNRLEAFFEMLGV
jgi:benzoyl-CoA reductase/2-hydroxyglutaryl-CoA dehydratase subunit BcrC/BadD/HgdB